VRILISKVITMMPKKWFYVKNDLVGRKDVKDVIQCPIQSSFGIRRPSVVNSEKAQVCLVAFNTVCSYIGTRDLVQEHIAFKVWPLVSEWEMPKETTTISSEGGLVYLKYTYRYRSQFGELDDEWLEAIEATSEELLGDDTKAEDEAMNIAFGAHGKRRLNKVFDVIGFVHPEYCFPARKQGMKRKIAATTSSVAPKPKRAKVITHRSKSYFLERDARLSIAGASKTEAAKAAEETLSASEVILLFFPCFESKCIYSNVTFGIFE
jgi:hypothetical protein